MPVEDSFRLFRELNLLSMMMRVILAMVMGGVIGLERERKGRAAGFRTYMLVALGAAVTMIISQYLDQMLNTFMADAQAVIGNRTDVVRLGTQVISGTGFLAAGTILVTGRQEVKGLTTAAGLWASACMGLAVGAGFIECVTVSFVLILLCIRALPAIESAVRNHSRNMLIYLETENIVQLSSVINFIKREGIRVFSLEIEKDKPEHVNSISALLDVRLPIQLYHAELIAALSALEGVISIDEV
ncbi:MAG: MgtC/SapB family protein [Oscillospiraceae bacterium]|nr:MgtC/SapB family protein [Oscillospiraceae bacterium]